MNHGQGADKPVNYPFGDRHTMELSSEYEWMQGVSGLTRIIMPQGREAWLATRYSHVRQVLSDPRFSRAEANSPQAPRLSSEVLPRSSIMAADPPEHARLRSVLTPPFTSRSIERLRGRIAAEAEELVGTMKAGGSTGDLVEGLTAPLPVRIICELLGVPFEDRPVFESLASPLRMRAVDDAGRRRARSEFEAYVTGLTEAARSTPDRDDVLSRLVLHQGEGAEELSQDEIVQLVIATLVGGIGSPQTFLSSAFAALLSDRSLYGTLCGDPSLVPPAVEELLRFVPVGVGGGFARVATQDVVVGDTLVRSGETVIPAMVAANRDASVYPDPHAVRFDRSGPTHLGFGHGAHHCVGAHLARVQAQEALSAAVRLLPRLRLAVPPGELLWQDGLVVRDLKTLPVEW